MSVLKQSVEVEALAHNSCGVDIHPITQQMIPLRINSVFPKIMRHEGDECEQDDEGADDYGADKPYYM